MESKVCSKCKENKPLDQYYYNKRKKWRWASCKKCHHNSYRANKGKYNKERKNYMTLLANLKKYGLDEKEYFNYIETDGRCEICLEKTKLFLDHDHKTNQFRGLLCLKCNAALGLMKDNTITLNRAVSYLKRNYPRDYRDLL